MRTAVLLAVLSLTIGAGGVHAQRGSPLERVQALASAGRVAAARTVLQNWWSSSWSSAPREDRQRALWLRGRLTPDPARAALDFRRLVVEYPGGPFTDRALFRLAQAAFASGDSAGARQRVADLSRDYPGSSVRDRAQAWLRGVGAPPPPLPPEPADSAPTEVDSRTAAKPAEAARHVMYAVQLGAFGDLGRASALAERARKAGLDVRIVRLPGSRLVRVRTGRFDSADAARDLVKRVGRLGFEAALVRDVRDEQRIGR